MSFFDSARGISATLLLVSAMLVIVMVAATAPAAVTFAAVAVAVSGMRGVELPVVTVVAPTPWVLIVVADVYSARPMGSSISGVTSLAMGCRISMLLRHGRLLVILPCRNERVTFRYPCLLRG